MATPYLNAYRAPLETATSAELAVELCDAALLRLRAGATPHQLAEARQAVCALVTMVNPDAGEVATNLLRLYEYCLHRMETPDDDMQSVRTTLATLRSAFAGLAS